MSNKSKIVVSVYFDTSSEVRGLVSVLDEDGNIVQTVGSAVFSKDGKDELSVMVRAAQYTLNAFVK